MRKLMMAGFVAAGVALAGTAQAESVPDAAPLIGSAVPVPGGFTAGTWAVQNISTTGTLRAGTTFVVSFEQLGGTPAQGTTTLTGVDYSLAAISKISKNTYRITLKQDLGSGVGVRGYWSDAHWFGIHDRDKVTVRLENTVDGQSDANDKNNVSVYDNGGRGF